MPSKEEIFSAWAPPASRWTPWVKPVLFATLPVRSFSLPAPLPEPFPWTPPAPANTALVVNLPGAKGVAAGLAFARHGYRPVALYNAVPASSFTGAGGTAVAVGEIAAALETAAPELAGVLLLHEAPPAFLLDSNRGGAGFPPPPEWFDNRSVSFTTDFPSAKFLLAQGIQRVVLVQETPALQSDLVHTLRRWQDAGITLALKAENHDELGRLTVSKPSWFGFAFQRVIAAFGLRRHRGGGFGGWVPDPSEGGGFG